MNHASLCITFILLCASPAFSQQPTEIRLSGGSASVGKLQAPVFSESGDHLFTLANLNQIRVHRTFDGSLIRVFDFSPSRRNDDFVDNGSLAEFAGRLAFAFGGKKLVVNTRPRTIDKSERVFLLLDTASLIAGRDMTPTVITTQGHTVNFVCSLGSDRLIFVAKESIGETDHLLVYDLDRESFDSGARVELNAIAPIDPNYQAMHQMHIPYVYLLGIVEDGDFLALRVTPAKRHSSVLVPQSCLIEKLRIRWDDRGHSTIDVVDRGTLPFLPTAVSPTLSHYLCSSWISSSSSEFKVTVGLERIDAAVQRPTPVRRVLCGVKRPSGYWDGTWSANGQFLFVGDGNDTKRRRPTATSIHDRSGKQLGLLSTGEAHSANVLAVSNDGRFVVTHKELRLPSGTTTNRKQNDELREYQVWDLKALQPLLMKE